MCDRRANCPNFRDESDCECHDDEFRCHTSGLCINARLKCDHDPDCPDASDEMGCGELWDQSIVCLEEIVEKCHITLPEVFSRGNSVYEIKIQTQGVVKVYFINGKF